ncbi:MAG: DNA translocase FtsK [Muribaculaceae bacterium]|nr:DNA translocase FtsK [Muribaculaceae bacterium]
MRNYDNYTPEINYSDELPVHPSTGSESPSQPEPRTPRRKRKRPTAKEPKPEPKTVVPAATANPGIARKIKEFFTGTSFRILSGLFIGLLAVYFGVAFCSYFSTCIQDQSRILSSPIGYATGISNPAGEGGARLSELLINEGFGLGSIVIIIWLAAISLKLLIGKPRFKTLDFTIKCLVALVTVSLIIGLFTYSMHTAVNWGGYHGTYVNEFIINFIGGIGAVLLSIFMVAVFIVICLRDLVNWILRKKHERSERKRIAAELKAAREAEEAEMRRMREQEKIDDLKAGETANLTPIEDNLNYPAEEQLEFEETDTPIYSIQEQELADSPSSDFDEENVEAFSEDVNPADSEPADIETAENNEEDNKMVVNVNTIDQTKHQRYRSDIEHLEAQKYKFPPVEILRPGKERVNIDAAEQVENKKKIEKTLLDFGIKIVSIEATIGPTVTLYEIVPATGVKISNIRNLVDDIALSLSAIGVRIIAPIPGKGTVGIEVANKDPQMVSMRTVIQSRKYQETRFNLPIALGSTISNEVYIADLAKMPHLLVAGATGQGKSVGLNAIITSILYRKAPHEVKFVMIDPKQVEFSLYNKLKNYYMAMIPGDSDGEPVITDSSKVEATLNSLVIEMENRYTLLKNAHTRNIEEYNRKIRDCALNPAEGHKFLPYIVVIVDEFGDLVMELKKNVELPIARLAQKARAVGMHVIIATQRPSTDVITGIIKANFPARISFKVSSGVDSKTILDSTGAQQLIGRGDMLIFNSSEMVRVQCAFIDTPEVEEICDYISKQPYPQGIYELPEPMIEAKEGSADVASLADRDPMLAEIARAIVKSGRASTSNVQRNYGIGYNRAGRIMDQLEALGVVGPSLGGKPRQVLVDAMSLEEILSTL